MTRAKTKPVSDGEERKDHIIKKKKKKDKAKGKKDKDEDIVLYAREDLDLATEVFPIAHFMKDRRGMIEQIFSIVNGARLQAMLPPILKPIPIDELQNLCLQELSRLSRKKVQAVLAGFELGAGLSSDSESETSEDSQGAADHASSKKKKKARTASKERKSSRKKKETKEVEKEEPENKDNSSKTLMELLELEMRARAIKSLLGEEAEEKEVEETEKTKDDESVAEIVHENIVQDKEQEVDSIVAKTKEEKAEEEPEESSDEEAGELKSGNPEKGVVIWVSKEKTVKKKKKRRLEKERDKKEKKDKTQRQYRKRGEARLSTPSLSSDEESVKESKEVGTEMEVEVVESEEGEFSSGEENTVLNANVSPQGSAVSSRQLSVNSSEEVCESNPEDFDFSVGSPLREEKEQESSSALHSEMKKSSSGSIEAQKRTSQSESSSDEESSDEETKEKAEKRQDEADVEKCDKRLAEDSEISGLGETAEVELKEEKPPATGSVHPVKKRKSKDREGLDEHSEEEEDTQVKKKFRNDDKNKTEDEQKEVHENVPSESSDSSSDSSDDEDSDVSENDQSLKKKARNVDSDEHSVQEEEQNKEESREQAPDEDSDTQVGDDGFWKGDYDEMDSEPEQAEDDMLTDFSFEPNNVPTEIEYTTERTLTSFTFQSKKQEKVKAKATSEKFDSFFEKLENEESNKESGPKFLPEKKAQPDDVLSVCSKSESKGHSVVNMPLTPKTNEGVSEQSEPVVSGNDSEVQQPIEPTKNTENLTQIDEESSQGESWGSRYVSSEKVQKIVGTSKMLSKVRSKIKEKVAKDLKSDEGSPHNLEEKPMVMGSLEEYEKLTDKKIQLVTADDNEEEDEEESALWGEIMG